MSRSPGDLAPSLATRLAALGRRIGQAGTELDRLEARVHAAADGAAGAAAEARIAAGLAELRPVSGAPLATLEEAVLRLLRLGCVRGPAAERAAALLAEAWSEDGGFGPPDEAPEALRLRRTAHLAAWLAASRHGRASVLRRASAWLVAAWSPARVAGTPPADLAAWAHFFSHAAEEEAVEAADAALAWCGRELERSFRGGRLAAAEAARVLAFCDAVAIPGGAVDAGIVLGNLARDPLRDSGVPDALEEAWAIRRLARLLHLPLPPGESG